MPSLLGFLDFWQEHPMADETRTEPEEGKTATESQTEGGGAVGEEDAEKPEKLHQAVEMKDIGPCKKHIKVTVDAADIKSRLDKKYSELMTDANVPGFRPGKAPRKIIEKRFARDVGDQVKGEVMLMSLEQLAEENDVAPLAAPNLDPSKIEMTPDGPLVYEFDVEVRPHFDLPNYKGLKLRRPVKQFTDEEVAEEERRILAPYGQLVPKPEGNAQVGDYLIADLVTKDGERTISELKEVKIRVEPRLAFKDAVAERFAEQVKGTKAGQSRKVDLTLSESAADPSLRGKAVQAEVAVKDVKTLRMPELSHEFLHQFGVHTTEQLRERVRVVMERRLEYMQRQAARQQIIDKIAAASTWELPQELLARQARKALARKIMEMRSSGIPEDEIRGRQRLLEQDALRSTALALKEHFVLQKIAEVEKIDVNEEDMEDEVERIALQNDESPRRVRARLEKDDLLDALAAEIIERKALDLILDSAEYEDVPLGKHEEEGPVATVEEQAVPGEMHDQTALPETEEEKTEGEAAGTEPS
jgi:trigger factor